MCWQTLFVKLINAFHEYARHRNKELINRLDYYSWSRVQYYNREDARNAKKMFANRFARQCRWGCCIRRKTFQSVVHDLLRPSIVCICHCNCTESVVSNVWHVTTNIFEADNSGFPFPPLLFPLPLWESMIRMLAAFAAGAHEICITAYREQVFRA